MAASDFLSAPRMMGVMRPLSVATAMEMSTDGAATAASWPASQYALAAGTSASASAAALITQSLTDTWAGGSTAARVLGVSVERGAVRKNARQLGGAAAAARRVAGAATDPAAPLCCLAPPIPSHLGSLRLERLTQAADAV